MVSPRNCEEQGFPYQNIAEGQGRRGAAEFRHFLSNANGSLMEIETQVLISARLNYISSVEATRLLASAAELGQMLNGLIASLEH
jgi:four helix bundle protein